MKITPEQLGKMLQETVHDWDHNDGCTEEISKDLASRINEFFAGTKPAQVEIPLPLFEHVLSYLHEHASLLLGQGLKASAVSVTDVAERLQTFGPPQTIEQQIAVLTDVMQCGPEDEMAGNRIEQS